MAKRPTKAQFRQAGEALRKAWCAPTMLAYFAAQGAIGGKKGKHARWDHVSAKDRSEAARKAVKARWAKAKRKAK